MYEPKKSPKVIIDFHFLAWIDRGIIPLLKNLLRTVLFMKLWLEEVSCVAN